MVARRITPSTPDDSPQQPPAKTPQARENQLVSLAVDLAEKQMREGTASAQTIGHFLKLATVREQYEREKLMRENELLKAKVEQIGNGDRNAELLERAMRAFTGYSGTQEPGNDDY